MNVTKHKVVTIDYTVTGPDGETIDTSKGGEPLSYIHGTGSLIPGLEAILDGKASGEEFKALVPPDQAYGERDESLVHRVPKERFPTDDIEVGMQFQAEGPAGPQVVTVVGVDEEAITIDANHILAGLTLSFEVRVVGVRDATEDELDHGHVHGPGGHHH